MEAIVSVTEDKYKINILEIYIHVYISVCIYIFMLLNTGLLFDSQQIGLVTANLRGCEVDKY